jgi:hypothetical protein
MRVWPINFSEQLPASGLQAFVKKTNTGEVALRCLERLGSGVVLGCPNSKRTQQNGADERKHGTHRQNIEPQGKVHVTSPRRWGD